MNNFKEALIKLKLGSVIAYPSEGVWGLGCDPKNKIAVCDLLKLKKRPLEKGLVIVAGEFDQLKPYFEANKYKTKLMTKWPGPHTWVVPTKTTPNWITGEHSSVALRLSNHPIIVSLCNLFGGPIISTSANLQGHEPAKSKEEVQMLFKDIALVEGNLGKLQGSTPIQDIETDRWIRHSE